MPKRKSGGRSGARRNAGILAVRCAVLPVRMRTAGVAWARQEIEEIISHLHGGLLVRTVGKGDVLGNLWLVRAAHEFAAAAAADRRLTEAEKRGHLEFAGRALLPFCKRIIQEFISERGMDGVWMDDGGMLSGLVRKGRKNSVLASPLRLNALWYAALEVTGMALRHLTPMGTGVKDTSGDHFERLAGRFRRAFTKAFWCEDHQRICPEELRGEPDHGTIPDAEQLLLMVLPASPMPKTKQLGVLLQLIDKAQAPLGLWVRQREIGKKAEGPGEMVDSPLHRAWLAQALGNCAVSEADRQRAVHIARPLAALAEAARFHGIHAFYKDGRPLGEGPDPIVTAEVLHTVERFLGAPALGAPAV